MSAGAARAAAALALVGVVHGGGPALREPAPCPQPRLLPGEGLAQVACASAPAAGAAPAGAAILLFGGRLDPNHATPRALEALPGVGATRAAAIAREARVRAFCAPAELDRVPGIGPRTRMRFADLIEIRAGDCGE